MLFNSYPFLLLFLPVVVAGFWWFRSGSIAWLIAASVFFYAVWQPVNLLLIAPSIVLNFLLVRSMLRWAGTRPGVVRILFWAGIVLNVSVLGYFKYTNFLVGVINDLSGTALTFSSIGLPLGLSFITFQKIALLVDVRQGRIKQVPLRDYLLFVLFFPPLISGPIVHYRELMPQFAGLRFRSEDMAVGATLFFVGLFKKVILADPIAALIAPVWAQAAAGAHPAVFQAWAAALGYMLQLYFDFSGYSEMAIGAARLFGIKLPYNFNSPLKATSIIDYWQRWHVTLTRFLTAYIFNPLSLSVTRKLVQRGAASGGRGLRAGPFLVCVAYPTIATMLISGVWHGAGYQFIVFGALHGAALVINHAWRAVCAATRHGPGRTAAHSPGRASAWPAWLLTFLFVISAEVFFRAPTMHAALDLLAGMAGAHGVTLPTAVLPQAAPILGLAGLHPIPVWESGHDFVAVWGAIGIGLVIALGCPNILQLLASHQPALGFKGRAPAWPAWATSTGWALGLSVVTTAGLLSLGRVSEFLYWQF